MDIEPSLALCERQVVRGNAYGIPIPLMPFPNPVWELSRDLIVEDLIVEGWNSGRHERAMGLDKTAEDGSIHCG